ncbi:hypothetical protein P4U24_08865 [Aeribacillus composti]|uniref:hypothetical protein n=1 Tax=Aeribacillus composti TaxID=1868734 RepID=UPI002E1E2FBB|nr:hypothetical protein [Aeribacillus composti]
MNAIQLKNELHIIESKIKQDIMNFHQHVMSANRDILFYEQTIYEKMMTYLLMMNKKEMSPEAFKEMLEMVMQGREEKWHMVRYYAENADSYSIFNVIVYLKRIWPQYKKLHRQLKRLRAKLIDDLRELKTLIEQIKAKPKQNKRTMQALETLYDLHYQTLEALTIELGTIDFRKYIEYMFIGDVTISKNEFLSLLNLDRSKRSQETIRNLPERIDRDTFLDAVFVDKIEDEWNDTFGEMIFDSVMIAKDRDPELRQRMLDKIDEIFEGKLPMMKATYDEYLQPVKIERMKPKLRLVKK